MGREFQPTLVAAFHGCDKSILKSVVLAEQDLLLSRNDYDWLGSGIYFFESDPRHAAHFAIKKSRWQNKRANITEPAVVGALIDLKNCLDLTTDEGIEELRQTYRFFKENYLDDLDVKEEQKPKNEKYYHKLDCAVVTMLHGLRNEDNLPAYDTVRGVFSDGEMIYPGSKFFDAAHIQLCVRNLDCIKSTFLVDSRFTGLRDRYA